ncbi:MAG: UvrD-helicase domain-containing protein [Capsulimonadaceae bacterium]|nr:UvrD-helicase domain-containing protein [Capsulimonadaceae bacterium]
MSLEAIRASAGSGKTYALTTRYLRTYRAGAYPEEILATTFTRKAAGEILGRIMKRLAEAAADATGASAAGLSKDIGGAPVTTLECRNLLVAICRRLNRVSVSTIDSFFAALLGSLRLHGNIPPRLSPVAGSDLAVTRARREALRGVAERTGVDSLIEFLERLDKGQVRTAITERLDDLIQGVFEMYRDSEDAAWRVLSPPPGRDAAEIVAAIEALIAASRTVSDKRYVKALCADAEAAAAERWLDVLDAGLAKKVRGGERTYYGKPISDDVCRAYMALTEHAASVLIAQLARQTEATADLLGAFAEEFDAKCKRQGIMTFSDIPRLLAAIVLRMPFDEVVARLDSPVHHLLLDEFQDTSPVQWQIVKPFADAVCAGKDGTFFCVGDAKQSIYGWRGAVPEIFDSLDKDIAGLTWSDSSASYRSSEYVLAAVNKVFGSLQGNWGLSKYPDVGEQWAQKYKPHTAMKALPGYVELIAAPDGSEAAEPDDSLQDESDFASSSPFAYEARRIAAIARNAPRCSVGVLMRKNKAVAAMIAALRSLGLDASEEGGNPIDGEPAVELVLSAMTLADHPGDTACAYHVLKSPLAAAISLSGLDDASREAAASEIRARLINDGYALVVKEWAQVLASRTARRGARKLVQLVDLAGAFERDSSLRPSDFVSYVRAAQVDDAAETRVRVMSVHKSKGLEFDIVFLPELGGKVPAIEPALLVDRATPASPIRAVYRNPSKVVREACPALEAAYDKQISQDVRESLCSLYVAMTRARYALHVFVPGGKLSFNPGKPPAFVPANIVKAALAEDPITLSDGGELLYRTGDENWCDALPDELKLPVEQTDDSDAALRTQPPMKTAPVRRFLPRTVPSRLEDEGIVTIESILRPENDASLLYGRAMHALLATVEWGGGALLSDADLENCLRHSVPEQPAPWYAEQIEAFRRLMTQAAIQAALSLPDLAAGELVSLWRERRFLVHMGDRVTEGVFDRVLLVDRGNKIVRASIIDFKTDDVPKSAVAIRAVGYRPQMDAYRQALAKMLDLEESKICATLTFLAPGVSISL